MSNFPIVYHKLLDNQVKFHQQKLGLIFGIHWRANMPGIGDHENTNAISIKAHMHRKILPIQIGDIRILKQIFSGE